MADAIVEGRAMWSSVRDALSILLGGNLGEIAYTLGTGLLSSGISLNARQLLLVNLLTDVLPAMAVAVRPPPDISPEQLLAEGPEGSLGTALIRDIQARAAITAAAAGVAALLARPVRTPGQASTTGLATLVGAQLGQTLAVRGRTPLVAAATAGSAALLLVAVQVPGLSQAVGCQPLLPHQWAIAAARTVAAAGAQLLAQHLLDPADCSPTREVRTGRAPESRRADPPRRPIDPPHPIRGRPRSVPVHDAGCDAATRMEDSGGTSPVRRRSGPHRSSTAPPRRGGRAKRELARTLPRTGARP